MERTRQILRQQHLETTAEAEVFQAVCLDLSETLNADLISIWFFNDTHTQIKCQHHYDACTQASGKGLELHKKDYPHYFKTIIEETVISASNALTHPATKELTEGYFIPNEIKSLLDFILHKDYKPIGIICCENRGCIRNWSEQDKSYLRSLAALVSHRFHFSDESESEMSA